MLLAIILGIHCTFLQVVNHVHLSAASLKSLTASNPPGKAFKCQSVCGALESMTTKEMSGLSIAGGRKEEIRERLRPDHIWSIDC